MGAWEAEAARALLRSAQLCSRSAAGIMMVSTVWAKNALGKGCLGHKQKVWVVCVRAALGQGSRLEVEAGAAAVTTGERCVCACALRAGAGCPRGLSVCRADRSGDVVRTHAAVAAVVHRIRLASASSHLNAAYLTLVSDFVGLRIDMPRLTAPGVSIHQ